MQYPGLSFVGSRHLRPLITLARIRLALGAAAFGQRGEQTRLTTLLLQSSSIISEIESLDDNVVICRQLRSGQKLLQMM